MTYGVLFKPRLPAACLAISGPGTAVEPRSHMGPLEVCFHVIFKSQAWHDQFDQYYSHCTFDGKYDGLAKVVVLLLLLSLLSIYVLQIRVRVFAEVTLSAH